MSSLSLQITRIDLHHELQLLIGICFLLDYLVLFLKVLLADFEQVFVCWKRYRTKAIVVLILQCLARQTSTYSKSAVETLKEDVKADKN